MASPTNKAPEPVLKAVPSPTATSEAIRGPQPSNIADYAYRIAAMTAGIALLMTSV